LAFKKFNEIAELAGIVAIIVSLVFVGLQINQTQDIAESEVLAANTGHRIEANNAIIENTAVWDRANSGAVLTTEESLIIDRLIDNFMAERISLFHHMWELGDEDGALGTLTDVANFFSKYPGVFEIWVRSQRDADEAVKAVTGVTPQRAQIVVIMQERVDKILENRESAARPGSSNQ